jgi:apolipoprotein N-acyltransferase
MFIYPGIALVLVLLSHLYGFIGGTSENIGKKYKIALIQGNIDQYKKWDLKYAFEIIDTYSKLTLEAAKSNPSLIIWPETATPGAVTANPWISDEIGRLVSNTNIPLLFGTGQHRKFGKKDGVRPKTKYLNSAFLINPSKKDQQHYDKMRLFPFGEYLPYEQIIPWHLIKIHDSGNYIPGSEFTVFRLPDFRFGVTICWEAYFPELFREFVKRGAQVMVNMTNEGHFGKSCAQYQLLACAVFRAVENKIYLARCANTGVSCIIDPYGRVVTRVIDKNGDDSFVRGFATGFVVPRDEKTFYTMYGDVFAWIAVAGSVGFLVVAGWKSQRKHKIFTA